MAIPLFAEERLPFDRGKQIYLNCQSDSGTPITAVLGNSGSEMPAALLPCANCHGVDGRGKPEGGVVPSDVSWGELTKPYRTATANGRNRPPYDEKSLARSITAGVDSAGHPLSNAMPRYRMSSTDLALLIEYMKTLGPMKAPGVTESMIRLATIAPANALGTGMSAVLAAYFKDAGEIHGRRVQLRSVELSPAQGDIRRAIETDPPFALVGGILAGLDREVEQLAEASETPLILPITWRADSSEINRQRFYLFPSVPDQVLALIRFSTEKLSAPVSRLAIVHRGIDDYAALIASVEQAASLAHPAVQTVRVDSVERLIAELNAPTPTAAIVLDPELRLQDLSISASQLPARRCVFLVTAFLPGDLFKVPGPLQERLLIALPTIPDDLTKAGIAALRELLNRHSIAPGHLATQIAAYSAAMVTVEALKVCGRELTHEKFRAALESLYAVETGLTPPITFARNRRVAVSKVHIAAVQGGRLLLLGAAALR